MTSVKLFQMLLWFLYPLVIFLGLQFLEPRYIAILLGLILLLRRHLDASRLLSGLSRVDLTVLIAMLAFTGITALTNSETLLRLYPATINLGMLLLFGISLKNPPSMVERFARLREPDLPSAGVIYTRRVTQIWCAFFIANGSLAAYTAMYSSREIWALYNGFIAYLLMGAMFSVEWLVRRYHLSRDHA